MRFEKWQGLGNDFIVTDEPITPAEARRLCDRRRGVGADGVLVVGEGPRMIVLNADGSRPEMCGNGLRCVAGWLSARGAVGSSISLLTDAGARVCEIEPRGDGRYDVRAHMGAATVLGELTFGAPPRRFVRVEVGNPHAVCFEPLEPLEAERLGPSLEAHIEGGVNVELATARAEGGFAVRVFERGVGWTEACGTGACAVVAAAVHHGLCRRDELVPVALPGGLLEIELEGEAVFMRGPAVRVFVGEIELTRA